MMFILDTNVISEIFVPQPAPEVLAWMDGNDRSHYWVTAISRAELMLGLWLLPEGARKQRLAGFIHDFFSQVMTNAVLPFGKEDADIFAEVVAQRRAAGRPIGEFDAQIAAIARRTNFQVVTRNIRDFEDCGVNLVNPWEAR